jgi:protein phosphatase
VIDGAAGGNVGQRQVDNRSAAGRAALADPPAAPPPPTPTLSPGGGSSAGRRPLRLLLVAVALLAVVVAGSVGTYSWALGHWFVGVEGSGDDGQVAVFRGLNVSVLGFDLFELDRSTDLAVTDLTAAARNRARGGITAEDEEHAERILDALGEQQLPVCRSESATASPTPSAAPSSAAAPTDPAAAPTDPGATGAPAPATTGVPVDPTPASTTSARATTSSEPGVDCREAD